MIDTDDEDPMVKCDGCGDHFHESETVVDGPWRECQECHKAWVESEDECE